MWLSVANVSNTPLHVANTELSVVISPNLWLNMANVWFRVANMVNVRVTPTRGGFLGCPPHTPELTSPLVGRQKSSFLPSYIIDVRELDEKLLNIIDMQFLCGYYEPTLLILFEPNQTWPG
mgnify:CR=1 FL=1